MHHRHVLAAGLTVACLAACPASGHAAPILFNFEDQAIGAATPLSATAGGLTAMFSGPAAVDPGAFEVSYNSSSGPFRAPYRTLTTSFLTVGTAFGATGSPLRIAFSSPLTTISLVFALDDPANAASLSLVTNTGGTATARGALAAGFRYPEGTMSFTGSAFTSITLSSGAPDFQVDDLAATLAPAAVPEPATLAVLSAGLGALCLKRRRAQG